MARANRDYRAEYVRRQEAGRRRAAELGLPPPTAREAAGHGTKAVARGVRDLFRASPHQAAARKRARAALSDARRRGWSLSKAARENHTTIDAIRRWAPTAFDDRGRLRQWDREVRLMPVVSGGVVYDEVAIRGSRQAGVNSGYLRALKRYVKAGDEEGLSHFRGVTIKGTLPDGRRVAFELEADVEVLDALAAEGKLDDLVVPS